MVVGKMIKPHPRQQPPNSGAPTTAKQPYSINKLSARHTTKTNIIKHSYATFGIRLSDKMKKPQLIITYQQLTANPKLTNPTANTPQTTSPNPPAGCA
jgi:hypothetical protein